VKVKGPSIDLIRQSYLESKKGIGRAGEFEKAVLEKSAQASETKPVSAPSCEEARPQAASEVATRAQAEVADVRAAQIVASAPDVREAKVAEIKAKIESGEYKVDAEAVAARLLASGVLDDTE
jgi:negative regulator of flagellin synthesis FlgM